MDIYESDQAVCRLADLDLSLWIVSAVRARAPCLRTTFFRVLPLLSTTGALPVFVVDGQSLSTTRNAMFTRCVEQSVELLTYMGMPVLHAKGEAEALCAQLNREGKVDACITSDSDAFLVGATTVVKVLRPNSKEPLECYDMAGIESGAGLGRKRMVAMALLIGSKHDPGGVPGVGVKTALCFVRLFDEDRILDELREIGKGRYGLTAKPMHEDWQIKLCKTLAAHTNFPNEDIINLYLCDDNLDKENGDPSLVWSKPDIEALVDMLARTQKWEPSYVRRQMIPMLSTIYLRKMASSPYSSSLLLCDQYEFHSIQRIKIKHGHPYYLDKWKRATSHTQACVEMQGFCVFTKNAHGFVSDDDGDDEEVTVDYCDSADLLDHNGLFLLTDEDIQLVNAAFPNEARRFRVKQSVKKGKSRWQKSKPNLANNTFHTPKVPRASGVQLSIKEFYHSNKPDFEVGKTSKPASRKYSPVELSERITKSPRRCLMFD